MRVEIYNALGEKLFDNEMLGGNVFDWHLQDGQAERVASGEYLCVVTVKNVAGKLTQKIGSVRIGDQSVNLSAQEGSQLTPQQSQAVGPIEDNASWTILTAQQNQTATVIAHDGSDGQIVRGRGALSFRLGDFFSGADQEQMRLTEEGNLGIGTAKPKFKLDVAGAVRARQGFVFNDGSVLNVNDKGSLTLTSNSGTIVTNASGTGTQNQLAKWTDSSGTLGDSVLTENGGRIGVGTTNPAFKLDLVDNTSGAGGFQLANGTNGSFAQLQNRLVNDTGALAYYGITSSGYTQAPILSNRAFFGSYQVDSVIWTQTANDILFATNGLSANTERMRIKAGGNIGIGTSNPASLLDVAGDVNTSTGYSIQNGRVLATPGAFNTFVGIAAGALTVPTSTSGTQNSFLGYTSGSNNTSGRANSFFGFKAGWAAQTGTFNSFFGTLAGLQTNGDHNVFVGDFAANGNTNGSSNVIIGGQVPVGNVFSPTGTTNSTGNNNTILGAGADLGSSNLTNATAIGSLARVDQSNTIVLGSIDGVNNATADTKVGIGTNAPTFRLHVKDPLNRGLRVETNTTGGTLASFGGFGAFQIDSSGTPGGRLIILENGNVSINSSSPPTDKLYINGDVRVNGVVRVPGGSVYIENPNTLIITSPNGACWGITVSNTGVLSAFSATCP
jgi:hypothetical protein